MCRPVPSGEQRRRADGGRAPGRRWSLASGTKRQKNALIVETCGLGCAHERFTRTFYELGHLAMISFGWSFFHGLLAVFLRSRTVGRVENHPVSSWPDLSWHLRSFESFGWVERGAVPRISRRGAGFRSRCRLWLSLGTGGYLRPRTGTGESSW